MDKKSTTLPTDSSERKSIPLVSGVLDYFPAALAEVAKVSKAGNDKHNPGEALHWAREKSSDHADCIGRHLLERGAVDKGTGQLHSAELAWRALALLQEELEAKGAPMARGATKGEETPRNIIERVNHIDELPYVEPIPLEKVLDDPASYEGIDRTYYDGPDGAMTEQDLLNHVTGHKPFPTCTADHPCEFCALMNSPYE